MKENNRKSKNISLIGMPGSGKSTMVKRLASALSLTWIDTDLLMEAWFGRELEQINRHLGNEDFLKAEEFIVTNIRVQNCVIATGGSVVYSKNAMEYLKDISLVIYLKCGVEEIKKRVSLNPERGLVIAKGQTIEDLYRERIPLYERYKDFTVETDRYSVDECVEKILEWIKDEKKQVKT